LFEHVARCDYATLTLTSLVVQVEVLVGGCISISFCVPRGLHDRPLCCLVGVIGRTSGGMNSCGY
ncbi:MAG: hypothetical protein ACKPKO_51240, partial [Candidatus Fonsibacter sp.]